MKDGAKGPVQQTGQCLEAGDCRVTELKGSQAEVREPVVCRAVPTSDVALGSGCT